MFSNIKTLIKFSYSRIAAMFYLGSILSYFLGSFFAGKETGQTGRFPSLVVGGGDWNIHFHHWLWSFLVAFFILFPLYGRFKIKPIIVSFLLGLSFGLIIHGIFSYSDWQKILISKNIIF